MAIWTRQKDDLTQLVHHSDRGVEYLDIRYTDRLAEAGAVTSVGTKGDSFDNALAEAVNGLYKAELFCRDGPWRTREEVELATLAWMAWWNHQRLHSACDYLPRAEYEERHLAAQAAELLPDVASSKIFLGGVGWHHYTNLLTVPTR